MSFWSEKLNASRHSETSSTDPGNSSAGRTENADLNCYVGLRMAQRPTEETLELIKTCLQGDSRK